ncbi:MAG: sulfite exporter TauE/SafE family protein [Chloroflexota bacterium]|nr:sulfite exporter TauE/SafE family protein [Chloroflexota bacterium]
MGAIVLIGAGIHGAAGFGFALASAPFLVLILPGKDVVPLIIGCGLVLESLVLWQQRAALILRPVVPLVAGSFVGSVLGALVFTSLAARMVQLLVIAVTLPAAAAMALGLRRPIAAQGLGSAVVGVVSGVLNATTGLSGPPVAVFLTNQGWERGQFRAALNLFFIVADAFTIAVLWSLGAIAPDVPLLVVTAIPFAIAGYAAGAMLWAALDDRQLQLAVVGLVLIGDGFAIASLVM